MKWNVESQGQKSESRLFQPDDGGGRGRFFAPIAALALALAMAGCSSQPSATTAQPKATSPPSAVVVPPVPAAQAKATLEELKLAGKNSNELARYVFEHHGCSNCHTLTRDGKFGFTATGKQVGGHFEGCISLLTAMNVIAQVSPAERTAEEKDKAARFQEFGCAECHQIEPGKMGLTPLGAKLVNLHLACTDVEKILNRK